MNFQQFSEKMIEEYETQNPNGMRKRGMRYLDGYFRDKECSGKGNPEDLVQAIHWLTKANDDGWCDRDIDRAIDEKAKCDRENKSVRFDLKANQGKANY